MFDFRRLPLAATIALIFVSACDSSTSRARVQGSIRYDGQPVDSGSIVFTPEEANSDLLRAIGDIREGRYEMDSHRGPFPGKYRVGLYWLRKTGNKVPGESGILKDESEQVIPPKYNEDTELTVTVQPGRNTFDFDLPKNEP